MDAGTVGSVMAAFGLSSAAGLNAWLPLLACAAAARFGWVELADPFGDLASDGGLALLGAAFLLDFAGDKVPAIDHVLHAVGTVVAPVSGAALFTGQTGLDTDLPALLAIVLGAATAGSVHAGRASVRPLSTVGTGGIANPLVSLGEDGAAGALTLLALVVPVVAFACVLALAAVLVLAVRRGMRRARRSPGGG